jgi:hypothetical protein
MVAPKSCGAGQMGKLPLTLSRQVSNNTAMSPLVFVAPSQAPISTKGL